MQMFFGKTVLIKENFSPELSSETTHIRSKSTCTEISVNYLNSESSQDFNSVQCSFINIAQNYNNGHFIS